MIHKGFYLITSTHIDNFLDVFVVTSTTNKRETRIIKIMSSKYKDSVPYEVVLIDQFIHENCTQFTSLEEVLNKRNYLMSLI